MAREWKWKKATLRKAARILAGLGLAALPEEWVAGWEARLAGLAAGGLPLEAAVRMLLCQLGLGSHDPGTGAWTPGSDRVYCFEMEAADPPRMYGRLLEGVAAVSRGELAFAEVTQQDDEDKQLRRVRFLLNGQPCEFVQEPVLSWDFYDPGIFEVINRQLARQGSRRRLYLLLDDCPCLFCFEPEEAERFVQRTGCMLQPIPDGGQP